MAKEGSLLNKAGVFWIGHECVIPSMMKFFLHSSIRDSASSEYSIEARMAYCNSTLYVASFFGFPKIAEEGHSQEAHGV